MDIDPRIIDLLVRHEERQAQGLPATPEELCRDCPELLDAVKKHLRLLDALAPVLASRASLASPATAASFPPTRNPAEMGVPSILPTVFPPPTRDGSDLSPAETPSTRLSADLAAVSTLVPHESTRTASPMPSQLAEYEVLGELGRGGMGVVYKARQLKLQRVVALKMILAGGHADAASKARFRAEAEAIARLQHPNIVQVFDVGEHQGLPFFSLEYCPGGSLARKLNGTPLPADAAARTVEQLALAMQAAHEQHVVHRDLKPANVLLAEDGTLKVTDFGLAKRLDAAGQTHSRTVMGTPEYMAPEQADGRSKEIGPAADVYALGAILYECLTGRPPFRAANAMDTLMQVVSAEPVPPSRLAAKVPRDLETICLKCLQKEPGKRYASARELAEDLRRFQAGRPIAARPIGRRERTWRWCRRNPAIASLLVLVVAVVIAGVSAVSVLAVLAENRAGVAKEAEDLAKGRAADLEDANRELEGRMARGLLRVLEASNPDPLTDPEVAALIDLAGTSTESLRRRFVMEAMRDAKTIRQLKNRATFALHAAVGLDDHRRMDMEQLLAHRLSSEDSTKDQRTDLALILCELGELSQAAAMFTARPLANAMTRTTDIYALRRLAEGLSAISARMDPKEAVGVCGEAAATLTQAMTKTTDIYALRGLAAGLSAVLARMGPKEAATVCGEATAKLTQAMTKTTDTFALRSLAIALSAVSTELDLKEAASTKRFVGDFLGNLSRGALYSMVKPSPAGYGTECPS